MHLFSPFAFCLLPSASVCCRQLHLRLAWGEGITKSNLFIFETAMCTIVSLLFPQTVLTLGWSYLDLSELPGYCALGRRDGPGFLWVPVDSYVWVLMLWLLALIDSIACFDCVDC